MMRFAVQLTLSFFILLLSCSSLSGQDLIETITTFNTSQLQAVNCQGSYTATGGNSLCVTDLEGACISCGASSGLGDNSSAYTISGIDVSEYCEVEVIVIASGTSTNGPFEGRNQCGEDRVRVRLSSNGESAATNFYASGSSFSRDIMAGPIPTGNSLTITIQLGTQEITEQICIEQIEIYGFGEGIQEVH